MSRSVNKIILVGNVGGAPKTTWLKGGQKLSTFSLAVNEGRDKTEWFDISSFGSIAEIIENHVRKGATVYLEGRVSYSRKETEDGSTRVFTNIIVSKIELLSSKREAIVNEEEIPEAPLYEGEAPGWITNPEDFDFSDFYEDT